MPSTPSVLLVHDDPDLLDTLTRVFEARDFQVSIAAASFAAMAQLERRREFDVVIAGWDAGTRLGAEVYRWVLRHRYHMRAQFVFVAQGEPEGFDELVEGRCLVVPPGELEEIVRIAEAAIVRAQRVADAELSPEELEWMEDDRPSLLVVEDEPLQLSLMARLLADIGFAVSQAESGNAAIARIEAGERFDVILSDWLMADGSGADLHAWLSEHQPALAGRLVIMTASDPAEARAEVGTQVPVLPKGQDSAGLVNLLLRLARG